MENETVEAVETNAPVSLSADDVRGIVADALKEERPVVPAGRPDGFAQFAVREEPMYRFDGGIAGKHDFSRDVIAGASGDAEARDRAVKFINENLLTGPRFGVDTTDTAAVNPTRYRPDLFLDEGPAQPTPLFDYFRKGGLTDVTPFNYSKLAGYGDLLDDHVQGVEPVDGNFAVEIGATVTPAPISGRIHITREVHDQQGNPAISGLVWAKFQREFARMLEEKTAVLLKSGTYADFITPALSVGASGEVIGEAIENAVADLQFRADGSRFQKMFGHVDLYKAVRSAKDGNDRPLYPVISPQNANGTADARFSHLNVGGLRIDPTWSLGLTSAGASAAEGRSFVADANAVHVWNSGLTKLDRLNERVEGYDIGAWAYWAGIVYDASGVLEVGYDLS